MSYYYLYDNHANEDLNTIKITVLLELHLLKYQKNTKKKQYNDDNNNIAMFKHNLLDLHIRHIASFLKVGRGQTHPRKRNNNFQKS